MWHYPIGEEVTGYNPYLLCTGSTRWVQEGFGASDNEIHPKRRQRHSHQLRAGGIPFHPSSHRLCPVTRLEQTGYVVHNR
jgi:hypothetical protein